MKVAILGAEGHRALAQVWRCVGALDAGTTVVCDVGTDVGAVSDLTARQRGLPIEALQPPGGVEGVCLQADRLEAFSWSGDAELWEQVKTARATGLPVAIHPAQSLAQDALLVFTARRTYVGRGALRSMRIGGEPAGDPFAPSMQLLGTALAARKQAEVVRRAAADLRALQLRLDQPAGDEAARDHRAAELDAQAAVIDQTAWEAYRPRFIAEMRVSCGLTRGSTAWARRPAEERELHEEAWAREVRPQPTAWARLLRLPFVVITCACPDAAHCHRAILRAEILPTLGAVDAGEVRIPWAHAA
jgi:hypothetical protein